MSVLDLTPAEAGSRILQHAAEGRLVQNTFHAERAGRELACMLGSFGRDVNSARDCPATLMPAWLARVVMGLFDRQDEAAAFAWAVRFGQQMQHERWGAIDWESVRKEWLVGVITAGLEAARPVASGKPYWAQVEAAHRLVVEALRGRGDLVAARSAAAAAAAAADDAAYDADARRLASAQQASGLCDLIAAQLGGSSD